MSRTSSITDERLIALIRDADPALNTTPSSGALSPREQRLLERVIASGVVEVEAGERGEDIRTRRPGWQRAWRRRRLVLSVVSGGAVVAAVAASILVLTASKAPSVAFAGWSADPTAPAGGQVGAVEAACLGRLPSSSDAERARADGTAHTPVMGSLLKIAPSEWRVVLSDTRGSFTMLILEAAKGQAQASCMSGSSPSSTVLFVGPVGAQPSSPPEGQVKVVSTGSQGAVSGNAFTYTEGRVGANVTGVTLVLADSTRVSATVANGLFLAWWPGSQQAVSEEVTTSSGTSTHPLANTLRIR